jgi:MoaA/NifB/PqqE/SkfB family radical SAM enzyme
MKIATGLRLVKGLISGRRAFTGPLFVDIDLTRRCNMRCLGCPHHCSDRELETIDPSVEDISVSLIESLARELPGLGTQGVVFSGAGEPLLHPRIAEIIYRFKQSGLHAHLFTNGILLDRQMGRAIIDAGLDKLTLSLWASSGKAYSECHPGLNPEIFGSILKQLEQFNRLKSELGRSAPQVWLNYVCNTHTYRSIDQMVDIAHGTGCQGIVVTPFISWDEGSQAAALTEEQMKHVAISLPKIHARMRALSLELSSTFWQYRFHPRIWKKVPCYIGWYHTKVRVDGGVMPCCYCKDVLGDARTRPLGDVWNSRKYQVFRRQTSTMEGLMSLGVSCNCEFCCFLPQNYRIHRIFKWLSPLSRSDDTQ